MSTRSVGSTRARPRISACACSTDNMREVYNARAMCPRNATASPRRSERWGFGGNFAAARAIPSSAISGPLARSRGTPRLCRGASERWGCGGHFGAPMFLMTWVWEVEDGADALHVQTAAECEERQEAEGDEQVADAERQTTLR